MRTSAAKTGTTRSETAAMPAGGALSTAPAKFARWWCCALCVVLGAVVFTDFRGPVECHRMYWEI